MSVFAYRMSVWNVCVECLCGMSVCLFGMSVWNVCVSMWNVCVECLCVCDSLCLYVWYGVSVCLCGMSVFAYGMSVCLCFSMSVCLCRCLWETHRHSIAQRLTRMSASAAVQDTHRVTNTDKHTVAKYLRPLFHYSSIPEHRNHPNDPANVFLSVSLSTLMMKPAHSLPALFV